MAEGMKRTRTGQEVRMADIPADAGPGLGAFENLHGIESGAAPLPSTSPGRPQTCTVPPAAPGCNG
jgi:hypothetical protein